MTYRDNKLFHYLSNILKDKSVSAWASDTAEDGFEKSYSKFMVLRYLSMSKDRKVREVIEKSQESLEKLPSESQYLWLLRAVPKQESSFISYIKA